ncbi:STE23 A-factor-processing enzyme [Candida maltosa Xu316]|uniref:Putative a-factor pheromone maturation protease n=1 Tax=Candida maltosa (strain Xu316) TaxID=1245528 RepID=M3JYN4_CANMX|nr:putative a-factor pheromone maturation protease [Candida maltosa Xu316]
MSNSYSVLADDSVIEKSSLDDRSYRLIKLNENDLNVLLIHDPTTDKAAASLDVNVGSFTDRDYDVPGLAHFCEHLLFMGTEKYPKENEYSNYLSKHSGHSNAYTASEHTNYYFQVHADYLEGALDRFAQFFISPLFSKSCQDREINAVDSEHKKNLQSDSWRLYQLDRSTSNQAHPYNGFSTGNYETLHVEPLERDLNVRDVLIDFHKQHYSSNLMNVVVLGKEDLDTLSNSVVEKFSHVPNKNFSNHSYNEPIYGAGNLGKIVKAKPVTDKHKLEFSFPIPEDLEEQYDTKPEKYFSHLLGHESAGSILHYLKEQNLATGLSAGGTRICRGTSMFYLEIQLTPQGLEKWEEVVKITFQYLRLVTQDEPQPWIWKEIVEISQIDFRFKEKGEASSTVSNLSSKLYKFREFIPVEYLLSSSIPRRFDPQVIKKYGSYLNPDNLRLTLVSQALENLSSKEPIYGTEYSYEDIPSGLLHQIKSDVSITKELHYPAPNLFIPTNFDVLKKKVQLPQISPYLIEHSNKINVFFKQDDTFEAPKGSIKTAFHLPSSNVDVKTSVLSSLAIALLEDELNEVKYYAELGGLDVRMHTWRDGFITSVSGYNDKLSDLLKKVLDDFFTFKPNKERFESIKFKLLRGFKNFNYKVPYQQIGSYHLQLVNEKIYSQQDKIAALEAVTFDQVQKHITNSIWEQGVFAEVLIHGNFDIGQARLISDVITESMKHVKPWMSEYNEERFHLQSFVLEPEEVVRYEVPLEDKQNINSCIEYYVQIAPSSDDIKLRVLTDLLCTMIREPCFDQLRTKEQLGYVVFSGIILGRTSLGFRILVQSERTCDYLQYRIEEFLAQFGNHVNNQLTLEEFIKYKSSLKNIKMTKLKNVDEETNRLWSHVLDGYYDFDARIRQVEVLESISISEFTEFFNQYVSNNNKTGKLITYLKSQSPIEFVESKKLQASIINYLYHNQIEINHEFVEKLVKEFKEDGDLKKVSEKLHEEIKTVSQDDLFKEISAKIANPVPEIYPTGRLVINDKEFRTNRRLSGKPKPVYPLSKFLYNDEPHL